MSQYFEISNVSSVDVHHESGQIVVSFESEEDKRTVVAAISLEMLKELYSATLNYMPGMAGLQKFHEDRLRADVQYSD